LNIVDPFFSIVIPSYNRRQFIRTPIDSCLSQSFKDFELIIVDDGSTDDTIAFLKSSFTDEPRLILLSIENGERGRARNIGYDAAKGRYVIFLDSDDELIKGALDHFRKALQGENNVELLAGKYFLNQDGKDTPGPLSSWPAMDYNQSVLLSGNPFACNIVVRKDINNYFKFREERSISSMEDWIYLLQNTSSHKIRLIDFFTVRMHDHSQRSMRNDHQKVIDARVNAMEYALSALELDKVSKRSLIAHSHYFCGIHAYLGSHRNKGFYHIGQSLIHSGPFIPLLILSLKSMIGRSLILKLNGTK